MAYRPALLALIGRKTASFRRQPLFSQLWYAPVWMVLGIAKAFIFTFSFRRLAPHLGTWSGTGAWVPVLSAQQEQCALLIGRTVKTIARYTPWDSNCFPQAITARLLLGLYGIPYAIYFGLMKDKDTAEMKAHAWVAAGRIRVTGGDGFESFTVVGCFTSPKQSVANTP